MTRLIDSVNWQPKALRSSYLRRKKRGHADDVASVVFSPEGNSIVSGSYDGTLKIWDVSALSSD